MTGLPVSMLNGQLNWKVKVVREPTSRGGYGNTVLNIEIKKKKGGVL